MIEITDRAHFNSLPDGSIVTWLRSPGDATSQAVGIIRVEAVPGETDPASGLVRKHRITWVSSNGGKVCSPEEAGVTFPVSVVWLGEFNPDDYPAGGLELLDTQPDPATEIERARHTALACATAVYCTEQHAGRNGTEGLRYPQLTDLLDDAHRLEGWLLRDYDDHPADTPEPQPVRVAAVGAAFGGGGGLAGDAVQLRLGVDE